MRSQSLLQVVLIGVLRYIQRDGEMTGLDLEGKYGEFSRYTWTHAAYLVVKASGK